MTFGEHVRQLRIAAGLLQSQLADRSGISMPFISDLERNTCNPSLDTVARLARTFGLSVQEFLAPLDFTGDSTTGGLPAGVQALEADSTFGPALSEKWLTLLSRIEHRGRRLRTKDDALEIYLHLRRFLEPRTTRPYGGLQ